MTSDDGATTMTRAPESRGTDGAGPPYSPFPVVGLGASAGGLRALEAFFAAVPARSGCAYLVLVHQAPDHDTRLHELLELRASIPFVLARDGQPLEANHGYICPPDRDLHVYRGCVRLLAPAEAPPRLPIDGFFASLAGDQLAACAAVVLSGAGSDGARGVREVKSVDGVVIVQEPDTAEHPSMPRRAIETRTADMILAPEAMPARIADYFAADRGTPAEQPREDDDDGWLDKVFSVMRTRLGHDFAGYKESTLRRRVQRRMALQQIDDPEVYLRLLRERPEELDRLFRDLLIQVTSFFRDPDALAVLRRHALPRLLDELPPSGVFRAWIPGCSTGEEVYSLAMLLLEELDALGRRVVLQLFGTDIDPHAIERARIGAYPKSIVADVGPARLERFFRAEGEHYLVSKELRACAVFSVQDLLRDPPFSRLQFLSCRNLLIYFSSETQRRLLPLFHYTLAPGGILMLGTSESVGSFTHLFTPLSQRHKLFLRAEAPRTMLHRVQFPSGGEASDRPSRQRRHRDGDGLGESEARLARRALLSRFSPPAVLVDQHGEILHVEGHTGRFLEAPTGPPSHNILDLAREGLRSELSAALRAAAARGEATVRPRVRVRVNGDALLLDLFVEPIPAPQGAPYRLLVVFGNVQPAPAANANAATPGDDAPSSQLAELERELQWQRENHQNSIEELESSNEELKLANEDLQSSNEELQSTNEELESSKEELQSLNEELQTVNAQLESNLDELATARDDMRNLMNSTSIASIFVDNDLRIRRFTKEAERLLPMIQSDLGRPIEHIRSKLDYPTLIAKIRQVLDRLTTFGEEVCTTDGEWFRMTIMPYRTTDNRIDGAVLTFTSIAEQKRAQQDLQRLLAEKAADEEVLREVFDLTPDPIVVLDATHRILIANRALSELLAVAPEAIAGSDLFALGGGALAIPELEALIERSGATHGSVAEDRLTFTFDDREVCHLVSARSIDPTRAAPRILLVFAEAPGDGR